MLSPMLIRRPMLMLLLGMQVMDTGLLGTLATTTHMDTPLLILCMAAKREPLMLKQHPMLNQSAKPTLML